MPSNQSATKPCLPLSGTYTESASSDLAQNLAKLLQIGDVVLLDGEIGAGKTHLVRQIIQARLPEQITITSPTFTLVQCYNHIAPPIWHYDLYRLRDENELEALGLEESLSSAITLIEWPEIASAWLRNVPCLRINITEIRSQPTARNYKLYGDKTWQKRLQTSVT